MVFADYNEEFLARQTMNPNEDSDEMISKAIDVIMQGDNKKIIVDPITDLSELD